MSRSAQENLVAALIILVLLGVIAMSLGYGPRARMVPIPVAAFALILEVIQLIWQNLRPTDDLHVDLLEVLTKRGGEEKNSGCVDASSNASARAHAAGLWRRETVAIGMVIAFLAGVLLVGPIAAIFLFTGGYFLVSGHYSRMKGLVYTVAFTTAVYLLFVVALEIQLYHGVLEPLVERFR